LHTGLLRHGLDSHFLYLHGDTKHPGYARWQRRRRPLSQRIAGFLRERQGQRDTQWYIHGRPAGYDLFSSTRQRDGIVFTDIDCAPDVIHLHWISGAFDYRDFFRSVPATTPIVWTLHDMNPFTGGCHYSCGCTRYTDSCGNCPQLSHPGPNDLSSRNLRDKQQALAGRRLAVVADSTWLAAEARRSSVFRSVAAVSAINYGVDHELFVANDKESCRVAFGLDPDRIVVCFGADGIQNPRKGMDLLLDALARSRFKDRIQLLVFGGGAIRQSVPGGMVIHNVGEITSDVLLRSVYSSADIFVIASRYEASGQTALEAMACGVPVVGFNIGGIPDLVLPSVTGLLAEKENASDLRRCIDWLIENPGERVRMGQRARQRVEEGFTLARQARDYVALYEELLA
jgi:glycosyltransferase involved in cell wall biosynthesis